MATKSKTRSAGHDDLVKPFSIDELCPLMALQRRSQATTNDLELKDKVEALDAGVDDYHLTINPSPSKNLEILPGL